MTDSEQIKRLLQKEYYNFSDLAAVTRILRSDVGCPWDREQDHHSIRTALIEETYEVVEAIDREDPILLREELGDLLFQVMFHSVLEEEAGRFAIDEVVDEIAKKMIHRHPHVFGTVEVSGSGEVLQNWEAIKTEEKQRNTLTERLRSVPPMLPALMRASKVGKRAGIACEETPDQVLDKLEAELKEMRKSLVQESNIQAEQRIGSMLMRMTELARVLSVDAEEALFRETERLIEGFASQNL